jgi:PAS domain S-box-containing protein
LATGTRKKQERKKVPKICAGKRKTSGELNCEPDECRILFERNPQPMWVYDIDTLAFLAVNNAACYSYGYSREEFLKMTIKDLHSPEAVADLLTAVRTVPGKYRKPGVWKQRKKDGTLMDVEITTHDITFNDRRARLVVAHDVTRQKRNEDAVRESEERFRSLVETTGDWVWETDHHGVYTYVSPQVRSLLGYAPEEVVGKTPFYFMPADEAQRVSEIFRTVIKDRRAFSNLENANLHKNGRIVMLETSGVPFFDSRGNLRGYRGIDRDITGRKLAEDRLKESLREKETLLREIYHRTKNNMQVISSLISLQAASITDRRVLDIFRDTQNRIASMSLIHEKLYQSKDLSSINLGNYILNLTDALLATYQLRRHRITMRLDLDDVSVSIDTATPCGLIINELMSNSLKYAFPDDREGEIRIALRKTAEGELELFFADDGVGFPKDFDLKKAGSLGLKLVINLTVKQLRGKVSLRTGERTEFLLKFRETQYTRRI